jgi:hypothetical protein
MPDAHVGAAGRAPECQLCPICAGLAALRGARPEAVEHLVKAGAELLLAVRALLEGAAAAAEPGTEAGAGPGSGAGAARRGRRPRPPGRGDASGNGLQRIDVG